MKIFYNFGKFILKNIRYIIGIAIALFIGLIILPWCDSNASNYKNRINDLQNQYKDLSNDYIKLQDRDKDLQNQIDDLNQRILILENSRRGVVNEQ